MVNIYDSKIMNNRKLINKLKKLKKEKLTDNTNIELNKVLDRLIKEDKDNKEMDDMYASAYLSAEEYGEYLLDKEEEQ